MRFLGQKVCPVACLHTHRVTTEGTLSGFQDFFPQPIIKDWPNFPFIFLGKNFDVASDLYFFTGA